MFKGLGVGCFLLVLFFSPLVLANTGSADLTGEVYEENGNIFIKVGGKVTQLTDTEMDSEPILSPDGRWVVFSRELEDTFKECEREIDWECPYDQLRIIDLESKTERMILESREKEKDVKKVIYYFKSKTFSPDSQTIYFVTSAYAVSDAIRAVDIDGKNDRYVTDGNTVQVVRGSLSPDIKKYLAETLQENDWRIYPKKMGPTLIGKALKDDVTGYLIVECNGVQTVSSATPLEGGWGSDGEYYASQGGRRSWTELTSPDGNMKIPIGKEEW